MIEEQIERIRAQVGDGRAICGLSGGVDSSVAALLVHRAIGDRLTCVFVDHGLMRKNEGAQVVAAFRDHFHVPLVAVDASERFLARLKGVTDPEEKRNDDFLDAQARLEISRAWQPASGTESPRATASVHYALDRWTLEPMRVFIVFFLSFIVA